VAVGVAGGYPGGGGRLGGSRGDWQSQPATIVVATVAS